MIIQLKELDPETQDCKVAAVFRRARGWEVYLDEPDGGSAPIWVPEWFGDPRVGDAARIYGRKAIRGLDINDMQVFYRLPDGWGDYEGVLDHADLELTRTDQI